jgi:hypothetical protein
MLRRRKISLDEKQLSIKRNEDRKCAPALKKKIRAAYGRPAPRRDVAP